MRPKPVTQNLVRLTGIKGLSAHRANVEVISFGFSHWYHALPAPASGASSKAEELGRVEGGKWRVLHAWKQFGVPVGSTVGFIAASRTAAAPLEWHASTAATIGSDRFLRAPSRPAEIVRAISAASLPRIGFKKWCGRSESNRHSVRNRILSPARLPVPPRPLGNGVRAT